MGIDCRGWCESLSTCPGADCAPWPCRFGERKYPHSLTNSLNITKTGDDTDTLRKVEARIRSGFQDGLPPHLLPNATSLEYVPGSAQSRIFVSSHKEFSGLQAADIQGILRQRLILVHGHPFDYNYGWDLPSFGRVYDVDKKVSVLGKSLTSLVTSFNPNRF